MDTLTLHLPTPGPGTTQHPLLQWVVLPEKEDQIDVQWTITEDCMNQDPPHHPQPTPGQRPSSLPRRSKQKGNWIRRQRR